MLYSMLHVLEEFTNYFINQFWNTSFELDTTNNKSFIYFNTQVLKKCKFYPSDKLTNRKDLKTICVEK